MNRYTKNRFNALSSPVNKKKLYKKGKNWVIGSLTLLAMAGFGQAIHHATVHADVNNGSGNSTVNNSLDIQSKAKLVHTQLLAHQAANPDDSNASQTSAGRSQSENVNSAANHSYNLPASTAASSASVDTNSMNASSLHSGITADMIAGHVVKHLLGDAPTAAPASLSVFPNSGTGLTVSQEISDMSYASANFNSNAFNNDVQGFPIDEATVSVSDSDWTSSEAATDASNAANVDNAIASVSTYNNENIISKFQQQDKMFKDAANHYNHQLPMWAHFPPAMRDHFAGKQQVDTTYLSAIGLDYNGFASYYDNFKSLYNSFESSYNSPAAQQRRQQDSTTSEALSDNLPNYNTTLSNDQNNVSDEYSNTSSAAATNTKSVDWLYAFQSLKSSYSDYETASAEFYNHYSQYTGGTDLSANGSKAVVNYNSAVALSSEVLSDYKKLFPAHHHNQPVPAPTESAAAIAAYQSYENEGWENICSDTNAMNGAAGMYNPNSDNNYNHTFYIVGYLGGYTSGKDNGLDNDGNTNNLLQGAGKIILDKTYGVNDTANMFTNMTTANEISAKSNWDMTKNSNASNMFANFANSLGSLDGSDYATSVGSELASVATPWQFPKNTNVSGMFSGTPLMSDASLASQKASLGLNSDGTPSMYSLGDGYYGLGKSAPVKPNPNQQINVQYQLIDWLTGKPLDNGKTFSSSVNPTKLGVPATYQDDGKQYDLADSPILNHNGNYLTAPSNFSVKGVTQIPVVSSNDTVYGNVGNDYEYEAVSDARYAYNIHNHTLTFFNGRLEPNSDIGYHYNDIYTKLGLRPDSNYDGDYYNIDHLQFGSSSDDGTGSPVYAPDTRGGEDSIPSCEGLFFDIPELQSVGPGLILSDADTFDHMFASDPSLTDISGLDPNNPVNQKVGGWQISTVHGIFPSTMANSSLDNQPYGVDMSDMFSNDTKLSDLNPISNWNTVGVIKMENMFRNVGDDASKPMNVTLNWNVQNVQNMYNMFASMFNLAQIHFGPQFNPINCTDFSSMFAIDKHLNHLNLSNWNNYSDGHGHHINGTHSAQDMSDMFNMNGSSDVDVQDEPALLSDITTDSSNSNHQNHVDFDTSNAFNMDNMFRGLSNIKKLDLSSFTGQNLVKMNQMFNDDMNLHALNLSNLDTTHAFDQQGEVFNADRFLQYMTLNPKTIFVNGSGLSDGSNPESGDVPGPWMTADANDKNYKFYRLLGSKASDTPVATATKPVNVTRDAFVVNFTNALKPNQVLSKAKKVASDPTNDWYSNGDNLTGPNTQTSLDSTNTDAYNYPKPDGYDQGTKNGYLLANGNQFPLTFDYSVQNYNVPVIKKGTVTVQFVDVKNSNQVVKSITTPGESDNTPFNIDDYSDQVPNGYSKYNKYNDDNGKPLSDSLLTPSDKLTNQRITKFNDQDQIQRVAVIKNTDVPYATDEDMVEYYVPGKIKKEFHISDNSDDTVVSMPYRNNGPVNQVDSGLDNFISKVQNGEAPDVPAGYTADGSSVNNYQADLPYQGRLIKIPLTPQINQVVVKYVDTGTGTGYEQHYSDGQGGSYVPKSSDSDKIYTGDFSEIRQFLSNPPHGYLLDNRWDHDHDPKLAKNTGDVQFVNGPHTFTIYVYKPGTDDFKYYTMGPNKSHDVIPNSTHQFSGHTGHSDININGATLIDDIPQGYMLNASSSDTSGYTVINDAQSAVGNHQVNYNGNDIWIPVHVPTIDFDFVPYNMIDHFRSSDVLKHMNGNPLIYKSLKKGQSVDTNASDYTQNVTKSDVPQGWYAPSEDLKAYHYLNHSDHTYVIPVYKQSTIDIHYVDTKGNPVAASDNVTSHDTQSFNVRSYQPRNLKPNYEPTGAILNNIDNFTGKNHNVYVVYNVIKGNAVVNYIDTKTGHIIKAMSSDLRSDGTWNIAGFKDQIPDTYQYDKASDVISDGFGHDVPDHHLDLDKTTTLSIPASKGSKGKATLNIYVHQPKSSITIHYIDSDDHDIKGFNNVVLNSPVGVAFGKTGVEPYEDKFVSDYHVVNESTVPDKYPVSDKKNADVYIKYARNKSNVNIHYVDSDGKAIDPSKNVTIQNVTGGTPFNITDYDGHNYLKQGFNGYKQDPFTSNVTAFSKINGATEDVYVPYSREVGVVTVNYVDANSHHLLTEPVIKSGNTGTPFKFNINRSFTNYTQTSIKGEPKTFTLAPQTITVYYTRNTGNVTIHYVNDKGSELAKVPATVMTSATSASFSMPSYAASLSGYHEVIVNTSDTSTSKAALPSTYMTKPQNVYVHYAPNSANMHIYYENADTGSDISGYPESLASSATNAMFNPAPYIKKISGYHFINAIHLAVQYDSNNDETHTIDLLYAPNTVSKDYAPAIDTVNYLINGKNTPLSSATHNVAEYSRADVMSSSAASYGSWSTRSALNSISYPSELSVNGSYYHEVSANTKLPSDRTINTSLNSSSVNHFASFANNVYYAPDSYAKGTQSAVVNETVDYVLYSAGGSSKASAFSQAMKYTRSDRYDPYIHQINSIGSWKAVNKLNLPNSYARSGWTAVASSIASPNVTDLRPNEHSNYSGQVDYLSNATSYHTSNETSTATEMIHYIESGVGTKSTYSSAVTVNKPHVIEDDNGRVLFTGAWSAAKPFSLPSSNLSGLTWTGDKGIIPLETTGIAPGTYSEDIYYVPTRAHINLYYENASTGSDISGYPESLTSSSVNAMFNPAPYIKDISGYHFVNALHLALKYGASNGDVQNIDLLYAPNTVEKDYAPATDTVNYLIKGTTSSVSSASQDTVEYSRADQISGSSVAYGSWMAHNGFNSISYPSEIDNNGRYYHEVSADTSLPNSNAVNASLNNSGVNHSASFANNVYYVPDSSASGTQSATVNETIDYVLFSKNGSSILSSSSEAVHYTRSDVYEPYTHQVTSVGSWKATNHFSLPSSYVRSGLTPVASNIASPNVTNLQPNETSNYNYDVDYLSNNISYRTTHNTSMAAEVINYIESGVGTKSTYSSAVDLSQVNVIEDGGSKVLFSGAWSAATPFSIPSSAAFNGLTLTSSNGMIPTDTKGIDPGTYTENVYYVPTKADIHVYYENAVNGKQLAKQSDFMANANSPFSMNSLGNYQNRFNKLGYHYVTTMHPTNTYDANNNEVHTIDILYAPNVDTTVSLAPATDTVNYLISGTNRSVMPASSDTVQYSRTATSVSGTATSYGKWTTNSAFAPATYSSEVTVAGRNYHLVSANVTIPTPGQVSDKLDAGQKASFANDIYYAPDEMSNGVQSANVNETIDYVLYSNGGASIMSSYDENVPYQRATQYDVQTGKITSSGGWTPTRKFNVPSYAASSGLHVIASGVASPNVANLQPGEKSNYNYQVAYAMSNAGFVKSTAKSTATETINYIENSSMVKSYASSVAVHRTDLVSSGDVSDVIYSGDWVADRSFALPTSASFAGWSVSSSTGNIPLNTMGIQPGSYHEDVYYKQPVMKPIVVHYVNSDNQSLGVQSDHFNNPNTAMSDITRQIKQTRVNGYVQSGVFNMPHGFTEYPQNVYVIYSPIKPVAHHGHVHVVYVDNSDPSTVFWVDKFSDPDDTQFNLNQDNYMKRDIPGYQYAQVIYNQSRNIGKGQTTAQFESDKPVLITVGYKKNHKPVAPTANGNIRVIYINKGVDVYSDVLSEPNGTPFTPSNYTSYQNQPYDIVSGDNIKSYTHYPQTLILTRQTVPTPASKSVSYSNHAQSEVATETIHYYYSNNGSLSPAASTYTNSLSFIRNVTTNLNSNSSSYSPWYLANGSMSNVAVPKISGWKANREAVSAPSFDPNHLSNADYDVIYTKLPASSAVTPPKSSASVVPSNKPSSVSSVMPSSKSSSASSVPSIISGAVPSSASSMPSVSSIASVASSSSSTRSIPHASHKVTKPVTKHPKLGHNTVQFTYGGHRIAVHLKTGKYGNVDRALNRKTIEQWIPKGYTMSPKTLQQLEVMGIYHYNGKNVTVPLIKLRNGITVPKYNSKHITNYGSVLENGSIKGNAHGSMDSQGIVRKLPQTNETRNGSALYAMLFVMTSAILAYLSRKRHFND